MRNTFWVALGVSLLLTGFIVTHFDENDFMNSILQSGLLTEEADISEKEFQDAFMNFVETYRKSYTNSRQFAKKYAVFRVNYKMVQDHTLNEELYGFSVRMNEFGDMSQEEFAAKYLGYKAQPAKKHFKHERKQRHHSHRSEEQILADLPDAVDWTTEGKVQKVKNQASCGSCWAFSAIGAIESAEAITKGDLPDLSEQQLVDCSTSYGNEGCNGGLMDFAFQYGHDHELCTEDQYPYRGVDQTCKDEDDKLCAGGVHVDKFTDVTIESKAALYTALVDQPVSVAVDASGLPWQFYFGGVVRYLCGTSLDHGVLAVGYGHQKSSIWGDTDYVKIKNSWGSSWGESGYIRISTSAATGKGTCGVYMAPSFPEISK